MIYNTLYGVTKVTFEFSVEEVKRLYGEIALVSSYVRLPSKLLEFKEQLALIPTEDIKKI